MGYTACVLIKLCIAVSSPSFLPQLHLFHVASFLFSSFFSLLHLCPLLEIPSSSCLGQSGKFWQSRTLAVFLMHLVLYLNVQIGNVTPLPFGCFCQEYSWFPSTRRFLCMCKRGWHTSCDFQGVTATRRLGHVLHADYTLEINIPHSSLESV